MARGKKRHMGRHRHRYHRRLLSTPLGSVHGQRGGRAASRKEIKYAALDHSYTFISLAFETYGPINNKGIKFLQELGRRLRTTSDDPRESAFFLLRISTTLQRFNANEEKFNKIIIIIIIMTLHII